MLRSRACFCSHLCDCLQTLSNSELASRLIASQEEADAALVAMRTSEFLVARAEADCGAALACRWRYTAGYVVADRLIFLSVVAGC